jgi:hypothetical protein
MAADFLRSEQQRQNRPDPLRSNPIPGIEQYSMGASQPVQSEGGQVLAYVHSLVPEGYIITSSNTGIRPILGFSFSGTFSFDEAKDNVRFHQLRMEQEVRLAELAQMTDSQTRGEVLSNTHLWARFGPPE